MTNRGQVLLEYLLLLGLVAFIVIMALSPDGTSLRPDRTAMSAVYTAAGDFYKTGVRAILGSYYDDTTNKVKMENPAAINGGWCGFSACIDGIKSRECACPRPAFGGAECQDDQWGGAVVGSDWSEYTPCTQECLMDGQPPGTQTHHRGCPDDAIETRNCNDKTPCPFDCTWGPWIKTECNPNHCGGSNAKWTRTKILTQVNAAQGIACEDPDTYEMDVPCPENPCPVPGGWALTGCECPSSVECGETPLQCYRECSNPPPSNGGAYCTGDHAFLSPTDTCNTPCASGKCINHTCCHPNCIGKPCGADDGCGGTCNAADNVCYTWCHCGIEKRFVPISGGSSGLHCDNQYPQVAGTWAYITEPTRCVYDGKSPTTNCGQAYVDVQDICDGHKCTIITCKEVARQAKAAGYPEVKEYYHTGTPPPCMANTSSAIACMEYSNTNDKFHQGPDNVYKW